LIFGLGASESRVFCATDTRIDSILFGCVLALGGNPILDSPSGPSRVTRLVCFVAAPSLLAACFGLVLTGSRFRQALGFSLQGLAMLPLFYLVLQKSWLTRLLEHRWVRWTGVLSYTLYLVHFTILLAGRELAGRLGVVLGALLACCMSFLWAAVVYAVVEKPCTRLRRRLLAGLEAMRVALAPAVDVPRDGGMEAPKR
jgi:peptidoglycan/LPS O-acetylase OafA/YrhL